MRWLMQTLARNKGFIVFMLGMLVFRSAVADWNVVPTGSMQPTIRIGDRILVDKAAYDLRLPFTHISLAHLADPQRGDIVVLDSAAAGERLVKRVIGIPGDTVALSHDRLYVNGRYASYRPTRIEGIRDDAARPAEYAVETYDGMQHLVRLSEFRTGTPQDFGPVTVPQGQYLLLGDDRDNSADSRYFGFVPRRNIVGRATRVVASFNPERYYLPRTDRLLLPLE